MFGESLERLRFGRQGKLSPEVRYAHHASIVDSNHDVVSGCRHPIEEHEITDEDVLVGSSGEILERGLFGRRRYALDAYAADRIPLR